MTAGAGSAAVAGGAILAGGAGLATGAAVVALAGVLGVVVLGAVVLVSLVAALPLGVPGVAPGSGAASAPSPGPSAQVADIPPTYLAAFDRAGARFGVAWSVLAGIYRVECDFGRSTLAGCPRGTRNGAGAQGPGQFLPGTWRHGLAPGALIQPGPPAPEGAGYATDGDGDGTADAWDPSDATAATARMLAADGAATDLSGAIFSYDHDPAYVSQVLALAAGYQHDRAAGQADATPAAVGARVAAVIGFATAQLGRPYQWGGAGPLTWDCSGLVAAAFDTVGIHLAHDAAAQYAATASEPVGLDRVAPGDLLFYGTSPATIHHVGIAVGPATMIDAPYTGAVVRFDAIGAPDLLAATNPLG